jgi:hypothetical protein
MSRSAADLPEDPVELRRFAAALATEVHAKTLLIEKLRIQLSILRTRVSGGRRKSSTARSSNWSCCSATSRRATPSEGAN